MPCLLKSSQWPLPDFRFEEVFNELNEHIEETRQKKRSYDIGEKKESPRYHRKGSTSQSHADRRLWSFAREDPRMYDDFELPVTVPQLELELTIHPVGDCGVGNATKSSCGLRRVPIAGDCC